MREVVSRGKHLLHHIGEWTLHTHLKMEGEWHVYPHGGRWRQPGLQARAVVCNADWDTVGFDLADIKVVPTRDEGQLVGHLGPDPLSENWDAAEAALRLELTNAPCTSRSWTSATWPASGRSTRTRSCSSAASCPRRRRPRRMPRPSSTWGRGRRAPTVIATGAPSPATPVRAARRGCTDGMGDPAAGAAPTRRRACRRLPDPRAQHVPVSRPARRDADVAVSKRCGNIASDKLSGTPRRRPGSSGFAVSSIARGARSVLNDRTSSRVPMRGGAGVIVGGRPPRDVTPTTEAAVPTSSPDRTAGTIAAASSSTASRSATAISGRRRRPVADDPAG